MYVQTAAEQQCRGRATVLWLLRADNSASRRCPVYRERAPGRTAGGPEDVQTAPCFVGGAQRVAYASWLLYLAVHPLVLGHLAMEACMHLFNASLTFTS